MFLPAFSSRILSFWSQWEIRNYEFWDCQKHQPFQPSGRIPPSFIIFGHNLESHNHCLPWFSLCHHSCVFPWSPNSTHFLVCFLKTQTLPGYFATLGLFESQKIFLWFYFTDIRGLLFSNMFRFLFHVGASVLQRCFPISLTMGVNTT